MIIIFLLVAVDLLIKIIVKLGLEPIGIAHFIPNFIQFHYTENKGAAFSMLQNARWLFISVTMIACIVAIVLMLTNKIKSGVVYTSLVFIVAGGIGNLIDRIFLGYVIDYIEPLFVNFAIFNFADCLVTVGGAILVVYLIIDAVKGTKNSKKVTSNE